MRQNRLMRLSAPQELFIETLVTNGAAHSLELAGREIGYVVTSSGDQLVELYIEDSRLTYAWQALDALTQAFGVRSILAQSFDPLLMFLGLGSDSLGVTRGLLYRVIADPSFESRSDIVACPARGADIAELAALSDDFFDGKQEINAYFAAEGLYLYRGANGNLIGAGVLKPVISGIDGVDIGMVVAPRYRSRGYGSYIVRHLKAHCMTKGWRPICGCSIDNVASQRALERGGFASVHRVVEFAIGQKDMQNS
jgi:GNAT superfamily N-acetyltransferase